MVPRGEHKLMLSEGQIYVRLKNWLPQRVWNVLGGEAPDGTNIIPRIEIKDPSYIGKGSKGSKKIDLIAYKQGYFLLTEIKQSYSYYDTKKLKDIVEDRVRRAALIRAMKEKRVFPAEALPEETYIAGSKYLVKAQAFCGVRKLPPADFVFFLVSPSSIVPILSSSLSQTLRSLF